MTFLSRSVKNPLLGQLVEQLWWAAPVSGQGLQHERILPTGRAQIIITSGTRASILVGPNSTYKEIERHSDHAMLGVSFLPGGLPPLVPVSADELINITTDLDLIWALGSLEDEIAELDAGAALDRFEAELVGRMNPELISQRVLAGGEMISTGIQSGLVPRLLGQDRRLFVPEFRRTVGVSLKHFERIERFRRSIAVLRQPQPPTLAAIAADHGYADQAHLTREIVHFAAVTPSRLFGDTTDYPNHIDSDKFFKT